MRRGLMGQKKSTVFKCLQTSFDCVSSDVISQHSVWSELTSHNLLLVKHDQAWSTVDAAAEFLPLYNPANRKIRLIFG